MAKRRLKNKVKSKKKVAVKKRPKIGAKRKSLTKKKKILKKSKVRGKKKKVLVLKKKHYRLNLAKHKHNPIIRPNADNGWESYQTFNPAAVVADGRVHLIYRAIGDDGLSRFGYADAGLNGMFISDKPKHPVFELRDAHADTSYINAPYTSGGSWGGAEDPRLTLLGDKVYMFFVALSGLPRLAITSIKLDDLLNKDWKWGGVKVISPPGIVDKSGCLFPEKIGGRYVVMHRIFPNILIDFVDDLDFKDGQYLSGESAVWKKSSIKVRKGYWDSLKIGAGAPPIKTPKGWLLIYYGVGEKERKYNIGAMLLDLKDPSKVLARTDEPILKPTQWYENSGHKYGVAYPCGAAVIKNKLLVYYGGADSHVCVAEAKFDKFVDDLIKTGKPKFGLTRSKRNAKS